jgi:hypothetical protein
VLLFFYSSIYSSKLLAVLLCGDITAAGVPSTA